MSQRERGRRVPPQVAVRPFSPAEERITDQDEAYFAANPGITEYLRTYVLGELRDERGIEVVPTNGMVRVIHIYGPLRFRVRGDVPLTPEMRQWIIEVRAKVKAENEVSNEPAR